MTPSSREPVRSLRFAALACVLVVSGLISGSRASSQAGLTVGSYQLVSEQPQKGSTVVSTYRAALTNGGGALASATATATSRSKRLKIIDGTLTFGPVAAGATVVSADTFSFSRSTKQALDFADIVWTVAGVPNHPPVANAGPDLTRAVGQTAQLDGSASSDQDGNPLTYQWTLTSIPAGSQATLSDAAAVKPTFVVDKAGTYVATLLVNDGAVNSAADAVSISTVNSAPVAHAGPDQTHPIQTIVTLNGSGSSDVDGNSLTYAWAFVSRPDGSAAVLADATSVTPSFAMDRAGTYLVSLVVGDGLLFSAADTVSITTLNSPPVANAGADQTAFVTNTVTLDGTGSTDVDGNPISYNWALISVPAGSGATLDDGTVPRPTFVIDRPGMYVAQLVVHDGTVASTPDTVTITTENSAPVANAGAAQTIVAGRVAVLDGNASSDVDGDPLTFRWSFTSVPTGSAAVLSDAASPTPSFVLDKEGMFVVQLIVNDGIADSAPATVTITTTNSPPAAHAGVDQVDVLVGTTVTLDGTQSADADEQPISYRWALLAKPAASAAGLADDTTATPTLVPDVPGDYVAQLIVNDGFADSAPDTVLVHVVPVPVVAVEAIDPAAEPYFDPGLLRLTRSDSSRPLTVSFTIGGTAVNGVDYELVGTTAFFDAGQATVDLPITPLDDMLVEGPESVSVTLAPGAEYSVGDPASAEVSVADKPSIELALVDSPVVGVGIPATLRVTLETPASHGGVIVSITSEDSARLEVGTPGSVSIADGETLGDIALIGLAPSTVTIRASAAHYQNATLTVDVVRNIISIPATFNAALGQPSNLAITIERDASNPGPVSIGLVSDDPTVISVSTPTIVVPAGELSASATIVGAGIGSTTLRATAATFVSDSGVGTVAAALDITASTLTINSAAGGPITIELESPPGTPSAAPAGGVLVNLSAANPACVSIPSTVTIAFGAITAAVTASHGGAPSLPCTTTVTATGPTGVASDSISVTVNQAPSINAPASVGTVGGGLQIGAFSATLSAAQFSGVTVRLTSSDATRVLLSPDAATPGVGEITINVPQGQTAVSFHVQGADWVPLSSTAGNVTITFSAPGFNGDTTSVAYVQPAVALFDLPVAPPAASPNKDFTVRVGIPAASNATLANEQERRPGATALTVTVRNSEEAVAEIDPNGGGIGAQETTAGIEAGKSSTPNNLAGGLEFDPKAAGETVVSATIPGFISTAAAARTVSVAASPALNLPASLPPIGAGLQEGAFSGTLAVVQPNDVIVHLESKDSRVLLATSAAAAGQPGLDIKVPSGQTVFTFHVQGTDWIPGSSSPATVTITASAEAYGFTEDSTTIGYVQAAVALTNLPASTTSLSASTGFQARVGVPRADNADIQTPQDRRPATDAERLAGIVPNLTVTVTSSDPSVGKIEKILDAEGNISVAASQDTLIAVGTQATPFQTVRGLRFDPIDPGSTLVRATIPGFITTIAGAKTVAVTATAGITFPANFGQLGGGLQHGVFSGTLGASQHGGVTVRLTSGDPTRVLLAPNATTPGIAEITFDLANGQTSFSYVLQATDWVIGTSSAAPVTITAKATGFNTATGTVNYVQPAVELVLPATTTDLSLNTDFVVRVGTPGTTAVALPQSRRAGALPLTVTVTNSNETVAELDDDGGVNGLQEKTRTIVAGQQTTPSGAGGLELDPLSTGTTVVTATIPGFITTAAGARTVTVVTPAISIGANLGSIGGGLQAGAFGGSLGASQHGGVTVRLESSDPSRVLLSPNATTPGLAAIDIAVANLQTGFSFFVQGTDWIPGTSSTQPVAINITAPGFIGDTTSITYVEPAVELSGVPTTRGAAESNVDFIVRVGVPTAFNTLVGSPQARRAGAPPLTVTVSSSDDNVAEIDQNGGLNGAPSQTATIAAGQSATPFNLAGGLEFDPKAVGTTVVTATLPGFITTAAGAKTVTINP